MRRRVYRPQQPLSAPAQGHVRDVVVRSSGRPMRRIEDGLDRDAVGAVEGDAQCGGPLPGAGFVVRPERGQLDEERIAQQGQALPHAPAQLLVAFRLAELPLDLGPCLEDPRDQLLLVDGLQQEREGLQLDSASGVLEIVVTADDDRADRGVALVQDGEQLQPVHVGHADVQHHDVGEQLLDEGERLGAPRRGTADADPVALPGDAPRDALADRLLVVDDQQIDHAAAILPSGRRAGPAADPIAPPVVEMGMPKDLPQRNALLVVASYLCVYVVWGSTYFFIKQSVATIPPFAVLAIRWTVGGVLLLAIAAFTGRLRRLPSLRELASAAVLGTLLLRARQRPHHHRRARRWTATSPRCSPARRRSSWRSSTGCCSASA